MKNLIFLFAAIGFCIFVSAQEATIVPSVDKSPMDMSYYPDNFPVMKIQDKTKAESPDIRVVYSRPSANGRTIFGELVEYGKVWRMGANEASEIEFYKNVRIAGKKISKGRYTLYAIPYKDKWTLILNKDTDTWGSFKYDSKKDVFRTDVPVIKTTNLQEIFSIYFEGAPGGTNLIITWEKTKISLPISL